MKKQQGFTLIELVVVIIILGILAVTAAPKFMNLQGDARASTVSGLEAAIKGADTLIHSKSLIAGNNTVAASAATTVTVAKGNTVLTNYGHAIGAWTGSLANALDIDAADSGTDTDWLYVESADPVVPTDSSIYFYPQGQTSPLDKDAPGTCYTQYVNSLTSYDSITVNTVTTGC
jgi:MSHA pilin protein MshA